MRRGLLYYFQPADAILLHSSLAGVACVWLSKQESCGGCVHVNTPIRGEVCRKTGTWQKAHAAWTYTTCEKIAAVSSDRMRILRAQPLAAPRGVYSSPLGSHAACSSSPPSPR